MSENLESLELKRKELFRRLTRLGDFRRGNVSALLRKCGKKNCACAQPNHPGHPRYLWSTTRGYKSEALNLRPGPKMEKVVGEVDNYREFLELTRELVEVNEKICQLRPVRQVDDEEELEAMKKKLQRRFARKRSKR
jgi:hypothetical protein